ncbi:MAG: hypothetical protein ACN2B6_02450 [Rickettsiales bacterium]
MNALNMKANVEGYNHNPVRVCVAAAMLLTSSGCSTSNISQDSWEHAAIAHTQMLSAANDNNAAPNSSVVLDNYLESF